MFSIISRGVLHQYCASICVNLAAFAYGLSIGWLSPNLQLLLSDKSPLETGPISEAEAWWVGSLPCVGGIFSTLICVWVAELFGRKVSIFMIGFPQLIGWLFVEFATNVSHIYVGRILAGFSGGGIFAVGPMFVAEIAEDRIRGSLGSMLSLACNAGTVVGFIFSYYMEYHTGPFIIIGITIAFIVGMVFIPESPQYLYSKSENEKAKTALAFYRGVDLKSETVSEDFIREHQRHLDKSVEDCATKDELHIKDFLNKASLKGILIGAIVIMLPPFSGNIVLLSYTDGIFEEAGSTLSPDLASITVALIQLFGSYISTILIDKAGRKILLTTSAFGCAFCSIIMGVYSFLKNNGFDVSYFRWIPISSLSGLVFICALGIGSIPFVIVSEILSQKIKGPVITWCLLELWGFAFIVIRYFPATVDIIGMHGCLWFSAGCCIAGAIFVLCFVPETKGKSFEEIKDLLKNRQDVQPSSDKRNEIPC